MRLKVVFCVSLQAFWKERGFSGEIVVGSSTDCPFCVTFDATSPNGNAALVGFFAGELATQWTSREVLTDQHRFIYCKFDNLWSWLDGHGNI